MSVKLLTEHHLEFLSFKGGCTGLYDSTLVKMPHCWKSHVAGQITRFHCMLIPLVHFRQYFWNDEKGKKYKESAPQYVDYVTLYIQKTISDESVFPTKFGK